MVRLRACAADQQFPPPPLLSLPEDLLQRILHMASLVPGGDAAAMPLVCRHCARLCDEAWWRRLLQSRWPGVCEAMGGCGECGAEGGREGSGSGGIARVLLPRWEG